eukprot:1140381-Pelagomonas_calceolata.AAC.2
MVLMIPVPFNWTWLGLSFLGRETPNRLTCLPWCKWQLPSVYACPLFPVLDFSDQVWARCGMRREELLVLDGDLRNITDVAN